MIWNINSRFWSIIIHSISKSISGLHSRWRCGWHIRSSSPCSLVGWILLYTFIRFWILIINFFFFLFETERSFARRAWRFFVFSEIFFVGSCESCRRPWKQWEWCQSFCLWWSYHFDAKFFFSADGALHDGRIGDCFPRKELARYLLNSDATVNTNRFFTFSRRNDCSYRYYSRIENFTDHTKIQYRVLSWI